MCLNGLTGFSSSLSSSDSEEEEYDEDVVNDVVGGNDIDINEFYKSYDKNRKNFKTSPVLSKYEKTRIISERVQQLSNGGIPFISNTESYSSIFDIALKELDMKKLPFIIKIAFITHICFIFYNLAKTANIFRPHQINIIYPIISQTILY